MTNLFEDYRQHWFDEEFLNPETGCLEEIDVSEVFYLRVYGEDKVLYEGIEYNWVIRPEM